MSCGTRDGRLRIKGGQPTQGALQISSASLIDPSSGDFDLDLPAQSVESVEVLANPFAAEYGRFYHERDADSDQTRDERVGRLPRKPDAAIPRSCSRGIRAFEPRLSVRGPIKKGPHLPRAGRAVSLCRRPRSRAFPASPRSIYEASTRSRVSTACCRAATRSVAG